MSPVLETPTSLFSVNICYINFQCTELFLSEITIILQLSVCLFKQTCKGYHSKSRWPPHGVDDVPLEVVQVLLVGGVVAAVLHVAEVSLGQPRHQQDITVQERSHDQIETKVGIGLVEATILSFLVANSNSSFYGSYIVI